MRNEREGFKIRLQIRVLAQVADTGHLDIDRSQGAAGREKLGVHVGGAVHAFQGPENSLVRS